MDDFDTFAPFFSQADAVLLTQADNDTLDNWVRYKHVLPHRIGKRRMFSFLDLLRVDLTWTLTRTFKAQVGEAAHIATEAAKSYIDLVEQDRADLLRGTHWARVLNRNGDAHFNLTRDEDGSLRAFKRGDLEVDSVMIVLPVQLLGRRLLAAINVWSGDTTDSGKGGDARAAE